MKTRTLKRTILTLFLTVLTILSLSMTTSAATRKNTWAKGTTGRYYYFDSKGELSKGLHKIDGKYYYFNSVGKQRNGWVASKGRYLFFRNEPGKNGYMLTNTTINGIQIQKNGCAVITNANKEKLRLLVAANNIAYTQSTLTQTKSQRLWTCFQYCVKQIRYRNIGSFRKNLSYWPEYYAATIFDNRSGDCYSAGCAFAYLATAVGYDNVWAISSGGHGWCKIGDAVYDPNWACMTGKHSHYFGLTRAGLIRNDPAYFSAEYYKKRVDR